MKHLSFVPAFAFGVALCGLASAASTETKQPFAKATLSPKSDSRVTGSVTFYKADDAGGGLVVEADLSNAKPGEHGIHVHEKGDCSALDASSAGGHFDPTASTHGAPTDKAKHAGDLGNLTVGNNGKGTMKVTLPKAEGEKFTGWDSLIGKAVVVHASKDDLKTQPDGAAGDRIACGVIESVTAQTTR